MSLFEKAKLLDVAKDYMEAVSVAQDGSKTEDQKKDAVGEFFSKFTDKTGAAQVEEAYKMSQDESFQQKYEQDEAGATVDMLANMTNALRKHQGKEENQNLGESLHKMFGV